MDSKLKLLVSFASLLLRLLKLCSFVILWLFVCCFCWLFCSVLFAGLFPAVLNLATNALITTNATCGEKGREMYCKLVEHVPGQPARNPQCRICDQRSRVLHRKSAVFSFISFKYTLFTMVSNTQQTKLFVIGLITTKCLSQSSWECLSFLLVFQSLLRVL